MELLLEAPKRMVDISPFKGVLYNTRAVPDLADVLAPPYDVISPQRQEDLYAKSDFNVVRLILGAERNDDTDTNNRYTRAAGLLQSWLDNGILLHDNEPSVYLCSQKYEIDGEKNRRTGFICRVKLEPLGKTVFPHERTLSGPKADRLRLMRACRMNLSQVFGIYADRELYLDREWERIMEAPPDIEVADDDGVTHMMWTIQDSGIIANVQSFLAEKQIVIADGHHRYETALNYCNERRAQEGVPESGAGYEYVMMYISNIHSQGFVVLPTHRIVLCDVPVGPEEIAKRLSADFEIHERRVDAGSVSGFLDELKLASGRGPSFGLYSGGGRMSMLTLKSGSYPRGDGGADPARRLDVVILQDMVLEKALGVTRKAVEQEEAVCYTIHADQAVAAVDNGEARLSFFMNPTDVEQVMEVATGGGIMPQKSTYFYPKLISGLVLNPL